MNLSDNYFHLKILAYLGEHFLLLTIVETIYFIKLYPIFVNRALLCPFIEYNHNSFL